MITKSDFMLYLDTPMHLWADMHGKTEHKLSSYELHLLEQGKEIEKRAKEFLPGYLAAQGFASEFDGETTFTDGNFQARVDALVFDPNEKVYDIYEIKSSTSIKKEHKYDVTFQRLVCEASIPIRNVFIVHVNKEYVRSGEVDISQLFAVVDLNDDIEKLRDEVAGERENAWTVATKVSPDGIIECTKPKVCPCPSLCHPELPHYPIYDLPRLNQNKARELKGNGVLAIRDIPDDFSLSDRQAQQMIAVKQGRPLIDLPAINGELGKLEYPLYFLDYETYNPAVPLHDGYKPYQHIVFQYSLHVIAEPGSEPEHFECLITGEGDPGLQIAEHLAQHIGQSGSVIVWNKPFEMGRNKEMAEMYPEYRDILLQVNERVFDLMECFSKGYYIHPDFHGSASIKNVLPVLVDDLDLDYDALPIPKGDEAMLAWVGIMAGLANQEEVEQTREALLRYCELDTMAMIRNWEVLVSL